MGRWTPLILMGGGLAILLGTLLGINFPMGGGQQTASNNTPGGRTSRVLPANINVNSTAPSRGSRSLNEDRASTTQEDTTPRETRSNRSVTQENLSTTTERRTSVAQNTTPNDSFSSPDNTSEPTTTEVQSTDTSVSNNESVREPIRALW